MPQNHPHKSPKSQEISVVLHLVGRFHCAGKDERLIRPDPQKMKPSKEAQ
jgi:hypothetical protein